MRLLLLISWPYARKRRFRTLLTVASIVLGVALYVGMQLGSQSVLQSFSQVVDRVAGTAQLQITAGENGFPEEVLERVEDVPEVAAASPVIETVVETDLAGQGSLLILGVDMTADQKLRSYQLEEEATLDDPLVLLAQPDSVIVSRQLADRCGLKLHSTLDVRSAEGPVRLQVRGIMQPTGLASAYGGAIAVMDLYSAQHMFGRGRMFDRIDVVVERGVAVDACRRKLQDLLGPGLRVEAPASRRQTLEGVTRTLAHTIAATSLLALLIAVFIIYNTFSIAVTERRKEIGILRALGAPRGAIIRLFLLEGAIAGAIGAALGLPAGRLLASGVTHFLGYLVGQIFGYRLPAGEPSLTVPDALLGAGLGVAASLVGAFLPALHAARQDPVAALRKGYMHSVTAAQSRLMLWLAVAAGVGIAIGVSQGHTRAFFPTVVLVLAAALGALLAPAGVSLLIRILRPGLKALWPVEGTLAADSLLTALWRTASTVGALMLSLAMAVSFAGISLSGRQAISGWLDDLMTFDLYVTSDPSLTSHVFHLPASLVQDLQQLPQVAEAQPVSLRRVPFRDSLVMLTSVDIASLARRARFKLVDGNLANMVRQASQGRGVILSEALALTRRIHLNDTVELGTPSGPLELPVVGIYVDFTDQQGTLVIDRSLYLRCWKDDTVDLVRIYLKPGVDQMAVRQEILNRFAVHERMFVLTSGDVKRQVMGIVNQWYAMSYVQIAVAVLVAIIGIVNSLTVSVIDRRRELGILRALGGLRAQIRRAIWIEAGAIGLIGVVMGLVLGGVLLWFAIRVNQSDAFGYTYGFLYPVAFAFLLVPIILVSAWTASIGPAETAVRRSPASALEYE